MRFGETAGLNRAAKTQCKPGILCKSISYAGPYPQERFTNNAHAASLPLLRPVLRSCGGIFTHLRPNDRSTGPSNYGNQNSIPKFGSAPKRRYSRPLTTTFQDTESVIELSRDFCADRGENRGRESVLQEHGDKCESEHGMRRATSDELETRRDVRVRGETRVKFSNV
jgi:hypothetical protein